MAPKQVLTAKLCPREPAQVHALARGARILQVLARAEVEVVPAGTPPPPNAATDVCAGCALYVPLEGVVDLDAERARLRKALQRGEADLGRIEAQLGREDFVARAPAEVVAEKRATAEELRQRHGQLEAALARLSG